MHGVLLATHSQVSQRHATQGNESEPKARQTAHAYRDEQAQTAALCLRSMACDNSWWGYVNSDQVASEIERSLRTKCLLNRILHYFSSYVVRNVF